MAVPIWLPSKSKLACWKEEKWIHAFAFCIKRHIYHDKRVSKVAAILQDLLPHTAHICTYAHIYMVRVYISRVSSIITVYLYVYRLTVKSLPLSTLVFWKKSIQYVTRVIFIILELFLFWLYKLALYVLKKTLFTDSFYIHSFYIP